MKLKKILLVSLFILLLLLIALLIAAPTLARNYVNDNGKELCGRRLNLADLTIDYFSGKITLDNFLISEENEKDTFFFVKQFVIDPDFYAISQENYRIKEVDIKGIVCNISIIDTSFNFQSLINHFSSGGSEK